MQILSGQLTLACGHCELTPTCGKSLADVTPACAATTRPECRIASSCFGRGSQPNRQLQRRRKFPPLPGTETGSASLPGSLYFSAALIASSHTEWYAWLPGSDAKQRDEDFHTDSRFHDRSPFSQKT